MDDLATTNKLLAIIARALLLSASRVTFTETRPDGTLYSYPHDVDEEIASALVEKLQGMGFTISSEEDE